MVTGGVGLAVPSNSVSRLIRRQRSPDPLGLVARPVQITLRGKIRPGLILLDVVRDSPAEKASLMLGDILIGAEGGGEETIDDLERALDGFGERIVRLQFLRSDRANVRTVAVCLGLPSMAAA
jgi:serine protease Do